MAAKTPCREVNTEMPYSEKQQRTARAAEHMSPEELANAGPAIQGMAESMSHEQLHDFATGPIHKAKHKHHREGKGRGGRDPMPRGKY